MTNICLYCIILVLFVCQGGDMMDRTKIKVGNMPMVKETKRKLEKEGYMTVQDILDGNIRENPDFSEIDRKNIAYALRRIGISDY